MRLYHGSNVEVRNPRLMRLDRRLDFGPGFYLTSSLEQASRWAVLESFIHSQTYAMLRDPELAMTDFSPAGIFDMWEVEQVTGNPRNSLYLRRDEIDA